jgi:penicillin G amidase
LAFQCVDFSEEYGQAGGSTALTEVSLLHDWNTVKRIPTPPDLAGPVSYRRAALGYPHITAPDRASASYALGCLHAIDRPIQVHLSLLAAQGRLLEFLGDEPVARAIDRSIRFFNFRVDAEEQAARLNQDARSQIDAYCRGFNDTLARRGRPILLRLLGVAPAELNAVTTIVLFRLLAYFGLTSLQHTAEMVVSELVARGAKNPLFGFLLGDAAAGLDLESLQGMKFPAEMSFLRLPHAAGSNAFAVSGKKSATGGALLMGEFHMQSGRLPPVLYAAHIEYPNGEYYQGVGMPGLCFLAAGRTSRVAWSYTYGHADNVDVLVEECQGGRYRAGNDWKPLTRRVERIPVRGRPAEEWVYFENEYGTTTGGDPLPDGRRPFVRWAGLRESASDLNGVLGAALPTSAEELAERHRSARTLSLGAVIADAAGQIAYVQTGQIDERPAGWTGAYPRRGWDLSSRQPAPLPEEARPFVLDPEEGFVVSANEFNRGRRGEWWSTLPEPIYRWERLRQVLAASKKTDRNALVRASYDGVDLCAQRLMAVWKPLLPDDADARALAEWAANQPAPALETGRKMMGLFHALHQEVVSNLLQRWLPPESVEEIVDAASGILLFQYHIDQALALGRPEVLDENTLRSVLAAAWPAAKKRAASSGWHVPARFAFVNEYFRGKLPRPLGFDSQVVAPPGGPTVPFQLREVAFAGMKLYFGPAFHLVIDMSQPGAWFHIPGGASERRFGPGYSKGIQEWLTGQFFPLGPAAGRPPALV